MYRHIWFPAFQKTGIEYLYDYVWKAIAVKYIPEDVGYLLSPHEYEPAIQNDIINLINKNRLDQTTYMQNDLRFLSPQETADKAERFMAGNAGGAVADLKAKEKSIEEGNHNYSNKEVQDCVSRLFGAMAPQLTMANSSDTLDKNEYVDEDIKYTYTMSENA